MRLTVSDITWYSVDAWVASLPQLSLPFAGADQIMGLPLPMEGSYHSLQGQLGLSQCDQLSHTFTWNSKAMHIESIWAVDGRAMRTSWRTRKLMRSGYNYLLKLRGVRWWSRMILISSRLHNGSHTWLCKRLLGGTKLKVVTASVPRKS